MRQFISGQVKRLVMWAFNAEAERARKKLKETIEEIKADAERQVTVAVEKVRTQIAAMQVLDIGFHETGKIILIARLKDKAVCHIIDIPPHRSFEDYRRIKNRLEEEFGVRRFLVDGPGGIEHRFPRM